MEEQRPEAERGIFGWRQVLGAVNLRDFAHMVGGELGLIGTSLRLVSSAPRRLPFGPLLVLGAVLIAMLRLALLALVVVVFGTAIFIISALRGIARRQTEGRSHEPRRR